MSRIGMFGALLLPATFVFAALLRPAMRRLCALLHLSGPNFQGRTLPLAGGPTVLTAATVAYLVWWSADFGRTGPSAIYLLVIATFGLLGLIDDRFGSGGAGGSARGFRGHLRALLGQGRFTTGVGKALGGGAAALTAAWLLHREDGGPAGVLAVAGIGVDALLIALAANAVNLLDVRPGRALAGFSVLLLPSVIAAITDCDGGAGAILALIPLAAVLAEWRADAAGTVMLGDSGANLLGASAGLSAAILLPPPARVVLLAALIALNAAAERISLTRWIAGVPYLAAIDRRLGVR